MASSETKNETNIVHSTPKRRRSANYTSSISKPSSQSPDSIDITHQEMAGLAAIVDIDTTAFMNHLMPDFEATYSALHKQPTIIKRVHRHFLEVPNKLESDMYSPLVEALQACFGTRNYTVHKTAYEHLPENSVGGMYKPDVVITNSTVVSNKPEWGQVAFTVEVKSHHRDSTASVFKKTLNPGENPQYTQDEKKESAQHYNYVSAQFQGRPQRGLFSISICGRFIRFYHWAPSRVVFTVALDYTELDNVQQIIAFFRTWEKAEPYIRGEDVAPPSGVPCDWEKYTFQAVKVPLQHNARWKSILEYARCLLGDGHSPIPKRPKYLVAWRFRPIPLVQSREEANVDVAMSKIRDFDADITMDDKDYIFDPAFIHHVDLDISPVPTQQRIPLDLPGDPVDLCIIPYPLSSAPGLCSRGTRCYLALPWADALPQVWALGAVASTVELDSLRIYTLKYSWQHQNRIHEINRYLKLQGPDLARHVSYVARALGGGTVYQPTVVPPPDGVSEETATALCADQRNRLRVLDILVLQDVGKPLFLYKSSHQLVTVAYQTINGLVSCLADGEMLHRDIGLPNIRINVRGRNKGHSLLIDFDMATAWPPEPGPRTVHWDISGLLASRALGLYHRAVRHRPSHDLESVIWVLLQMLIQYSPSVKLYGVGRDQDAFAAKQRDALSGFDDATPDIQSFAKKQGLIRSYSLGSSVNTLATTLLSLNELMSRAFTAFEHAQVNLVVWKFASQNYEASQRTPLEESYQKAKGEAIKARFTHAEVLEILKRGLDSDGWPGDDAAVPFTRLKHNEPLPMIAEEYSRTTELSAQMSLQHSLSRSAGQKRAHNQAKDGREEGDDNNPAEDLDAKRRRKDIDTDDDTDEDEGEGDVTEPPNTEASDWREGCMSVDGDGATESGEEEI